MDCNKEDAIKAREVAEGKIKSEDYIGAKKFILKSQRLFPSLGGIPQMLAVVNVHLSAHEVGDELFAKWHQILQMEECVDEETVRKQYRKLLLLLHPDKNKYAGAESAFKLVQSAHEAFEKGKELAKASVDVSACQRFWSVCTECKTPSEYLGSMENQYVQCPHCLQSFLSVRCPRSNETSQSKSKEEYTSNMQETTHQGLNEDTKAERREDELKTEVETLSSSSSSFEDFERRRRRRNDVKSKRKAKLSPSKLTEEAEKKMGQKIRQGWSTKRKVPAENMDTQAGGSSQKRRRATCIVDTDSDCSCDTSPRIFRMDSTCHSEKDKNFHIEETIYQSAKEVAGMQGPDVDAVGTSRSRMKETDSMQSAEAQFGDCSGHQEYENVKDDAKKDADPKAVVFEKLKSTIMNELKGGEFKVVEIRQENSSGSALYGEQGASSNEEIFHLKINVSFTGAATGAHVHAISEDCMVGGSEVWEEEHESIQCEVPDNDVFNFDDGRQEGCFEVGQIWAIYDDDDGLPRFYARIIEVFSVQPFHVRMRWLYPAKPISEEVKAWTNNGFAYTCGEFALGKSVFRKKVGIFSHIMAHETGAHETIRIYPQKGDVWALYRVWKPHKGKTRRCEAVVVLSHYCKELGVQVATLFKVNGYKSIYCRKGTEGFRNIPASELARFSHQIPAQYLVGNELSNLPAEDCVDLDTAAFNSQNAG